MPLALRTAQTLVAAGVVEPNARWAYAKAAGKSAAWRSATDTAAADAAADAGPYENGSKRGQDLVDHVTAPAMSA